MSNRVLENIIIITLIGVIFCLVFPIVQRIIYKSDLEGVKASVYGNIDSVKLLYLTESNSDEIDLPFTVVFFIAYAAEDVIKVFLCFRRFASYKWIMPLTSSNNTQTE